MFSTPTNNPFEKCYISSSYFNQYSKEWSDQATIFRAGLREESDTEKFEDVINQELDNEISDFKYIDNMSMNYDTMKNGASMTASILMGILTVFAILLILISIIIIQFNINNSIEMNMKNIGILQASGYTSKQMKATTMLEFIFISIIGAGFGLIASNFASNAVGGILSSSIGVYWKMSFDVVSALLSMIITFALILVAVMISSRKFKKISPLDALRNGVHTHNFNKSLIRLDATKLPLNTAIGLKNILFNKKKSIEVGVIIVILSFFANFAVSIYQNFGLSEDKLIEFSGFEMPDVQVTLKEEDTQKLKSSIETIKQKLESVNGLYQILEYKTYDIVCKNGEFEESIKFDIYDNADNLRVDNIVEGKRPQYDNEVILSTVMADKLKV
jgi:putative ABC transport system permease protein